MPVIDVPFPYFLVAVVVGCILWTQTQTFKLRHIPTIGTTIPVLSYLESFKFVQGALQILQQGYNKYVSREGIFKVAMPDQWLVVVSSPVLVEELRKMPADVADLTGAVHQLFGGPEELAMGDLEPIHIPILYSRFNQTLGDTFPAVRDEILYTFDADIGLPDDWRSVPATMTMTKIFMKTVNRVMFGLPLCRDATFIGRVNAYLFRNHHVLPILKGVPLSLKPLVSKLVLPGPQALHALQENLGPIIRERRQQVQKYEEANEIWYDKPNDMLMWLIDEAVARGYSDEIITFFLMDTVGAAVFNTAASFVHALFYLAADPSLAIPLREEAEAALASEGGEWTRAAVTGLVKMDSFLRESQRLHGVHKTTLWRVLRKPLMFSNGISLPTGTFVSAATTPYHTDEERYKNPFTFDPWRFVGTSKSFVTTTVDYLAFGHGRYACPGRHLAAYEMKLMMAHIVMTYDVAFESTITGSRPTDRHVGIVTFPDPSTNVMFRRRSQST